MKSVDLFTIADNTKNIPEAYYPITASLKIWEAYTEWSESLFRIKNVQFRHNIQHKLAMLNFEK